MTILIDNEAIRQLQSPLDIEKFGRRYKTVNELFSFPDPNLESIDKNLYYLLKNSDEFEFEQKYKYRPDYLSYDYYGTTILWELIMYVNNIFSVEDFDLDVVVLPTLAAVTSILPDTIAIPQPDDLQEINW